MNLALASFLSALLLTNPIFLKACPFLEMHTVREMINAVVEGLNFGPYKGSQLPLIDAPPNIQYDDKNGRKLRGIKDIDLVAATSTSPPSKSPVTRSPSGVINNNSGNNGGGGNTGGGSGGNGGGGSGGNGGGSNVPPPNTLPSPPPPPPPSNPLPPPSLNPPPNTPPQALPTRSPTTASRGPTATPPSASTSQLPTSGSTVAGFCAKMAGNPFVPSAAKTCSAYKSVLSDFNALMAINSADAFTLSDILGQAVRIAFHDAGEIDIRATDAMGPDGCLSPSSDNAGLIESGTSKILTVLEPIWQKYCDQISRADFWFLFAKLSVEFAAGGPGNINIPYYWGRIDKIPGSCSPPVTTRLPNAQLGLGMLNTVFVSQMGMTLIDAVTLLGAHTLGHVHTTNSGYGAPGINPTANAAINSWDGTPTIFDNRYYNRLLNIPWRNTGAVTNSAGSSIDTWVNGGASTVMLNADMNLAYAISTAGTNSVGVSGQNCVTAAGAAAGTCNNPTAATTTSTLATVVNYANNNNVFLTAFATSFAKMGAVGYNVNGVSTTTKSPALGTLQPINLLACP